MFFLCLCWISVYIQAYSFTTSKQYNVYTPNTLTFTFSNTPLSAGTGTLYIYALGDFNASSEYATLRDENGNSLGNFFASTNQSQSQVSASISLSQSSLNSWASNGSISFSLKPSSSVNNIGSPYAYMKLTYTDAVTLATANWTGANSNWNTASNWSTSAVPNNGTTKYNVNISNGSQVTLNTTSTVNSLSISSGNKLTISTANMLTLSNDGTTNAGKLTNNGNMVVNSGGSLSINSLDGSGSIANSGTMTATAGITNNNVVTNSGTMNVNGALTNSNSLTNTGTTSVSSSLSNNGTITNSSGSMSVSGTVSNAGSFTNNATMTASSTLGNTGTLSNTGTMTVTGAITNSNSMTNSGTLNANSTLTNSSILTNNGTLNTSSTLTNSSGTLTNNGTLNASGTISNSSSLVVGSAGNLKLNGVSITGTGTVTNNGIITVNGGSSTFSSLSKLVNAGVLQTANNGTLNLGSGTLNNTLGTIKAENGTVNFSNSSVVNNGTILAAANGVVNLKNATLNNVSLEKSSNGQYKQTGNSNMWMMGLIQNNDLLSLEDGAQSIINSDTTIKNLGTGSITVGGSGSDTGFQLTDGKNLTVEGGTIQMSSESKSKITATQLASQFINKGGKLKGAGQIQAALQNLANSSIEADIAGKVLQVLNSLSGIRNSGQLRALNQAKLYLDGVIDNAAGKIEALNSSTVEIAANGSINGGSLNIDTHGKLLVQQGLQAQGLAVTMNNGGNITVGNTLNLDSASTLALGTSRDTVVQASQIVNSGVISGSGTLDAQVVNSDGTIKVGNSPGIITVTGDLVLGSESVTEMEIWGTTPGDSINGYDQIIVGGNMVYGGILDVIVDLQKVAIEQLLNIYLFRFDNGTASGAFSQVRFWQNAEKTIALSGLSLYYHSHSLSLNSIPEPSTLFLFFIPVFILVYRRFNRH